MVKPDKTGEICSVPAALVEAPVIIKPAFCDEQLFPKI